MNTTLARDVVRHLGGDWLGHYGLAPGPGHSKKDRSLKIKPHPSDNGDIILYSFAGEDWRDLKDELRRKGVLPAKDFGAARPPDPAAAAIARARRAEAERQTAADAARQLDKAQWLWDKSEDADGTVVEAYLRWRGIALDAWPCTVRYLPADPPKHPYPCMLAWVGMAREIAPGVLAISAVRLKGVHLTYLAHDGQGKAPVKPVRKMIGHSSGWPLVLAPPNDGLALVIAEGIETALSAHQVSGMGAWAAGAAGRMPALADRVPACIETVTLAAEDDDASRRHVPELARRLAARGIEVFIAEAAHGA